jgi:hypothetical protein
MSLTDLQREESKLTGNIDSYAAWNNDIHKELKMKYYVEDINERIENDDLTKQLNEDYNNRNFPPKYPAGQNINELIKEEELQHKIELRNKNPVINAKIPAEQLIPTKSEITTKKNMIKTVLNNELHDLFKESKEKVPEIVLDKVVDNIFNEFIDEGIKKKEDSIKSFVNDIVNNATKNITRKAVNLEKFNVLYDKNKKLEDQAKKNNDLAFKQQKIEQIEDDMEEKAPPKRRYSDSSEYTMGTNTDIMSTQQNTVKGAIFGKFNDYTNAEEYIPYIYNELSKIKGNKFENISNTGKKRILTREENKLIFNDDGKITEFNINSNKKQTNVSSLKNFMKKIIQSSTSIMQPNAGLRSKKSKKAKKMTIEQYKNRFLILKGEVLSGNDNPDVVKELKAVIKILDANKLLNKK